MRANSLGACSGARVNGRAPAPSLVSSTSCPACQKNRYGLIVMPITATTAIRYSASKDSGGQTTAQATSPHVHNEGADHIAEQQQAPPFQDGDVARVAGQDLQPGR